VAFRWRRRPARFPLAGTRAYLTAASPACHRLSLSRIPPRFLRSSVASARSPPLGWFRLG